jgi:hypothetical protein
MSFDMRRQTSPQISLPEENTTTSPGTKSLWLIVIAVLQERLPGISPSLYDSGIIPVPIVWILPKYYSTPANTQQQSVSEQVVGYLILFQIAL